MWLMALLLLIPSLAFAQDMPDVVQVTVNVAFALPTQSTPVTISGTALYQNSGPSPGYRSQSFVVTGEALIDNRQRIGPYAMQPTPCCPTILWLQAPWADPKNAANTGTTTIEMTFEPSAGKTTLAPGGYPLSARYESVGVSNNFFTYASGGSQRVGVIGAPELSILRSVAKHLGGQRVNAAFNPPLQRVTTWGAAMMLGAEHEGDRIYLRSAILEVQEWCSGLVTMKWLLVLALICLAVGRLSWPWSLVILAAVPLIAIEVNILRVMGIGLGLEWFGVASRVAVKEWTGWGAIGLGLAQVVGLGAMAREGEQRERASIRQSFVEAHRRIGALARRARRAMQAP